jgi:hypothetical protein
MRARGLVPASQLDGLEGTGYGGVKEGIRYGHGGKRFGSYVEIGSCSSEARMGRAGFQIEPESLGLGSRPKAGTLIIPLSLSLVMPRVERGLAETGVLPDNAASCRRCPALK